MARDTIPALHAACTALQALAAPRPQAVKALRAAALTASFFVAISAYPVNATGQNASNTAAACLAATDMTHQHLQGVWHAQFQTVAPAGSENAATDIGPTTATVHLGAHPELAQSVRGTVQRGAVTAQVSGDVDEGDFTLEESINGINISATWTGRMVDASCGKEINGIWNNATPLPGSAPVTFVLRKQPSWQ